MHSNACYSPDDWELKLANMNSVFSWKTENGLEAEKGVHSQEAGISAGAETKWVKNDLSSKLIVPSLREEKRQYL